MNWGAHRDVARRPVRYPDGPIVLLGASYLAEWSLGDVAGREVVNCGVPGHQTHEYLERFARDVVALRPRAVIIWGIANDIIRAPRDRIDLACDRAIGNLAELVRLAHENGIEPVLATDPTLRPPVGWVEALAAIAGALRGKQSYQDFINRLVLRVNREIIVLARRTHTQLLDLQPLLSGRDGVRLGAYAKEDGSHLTDAAYRVITGYVVPRLEAWLSPPPATQQLARAAGA